MAGTYAMIILPLEKEARKANTITAIQNIDIWYESEDGSNIHAICIDGKILREALLKSKMHNTKGTFTDTRQYYFLMLMTSITCNRVR